MAKRPKPSVYWAIFEEANGPGPWPCYGCDELVRPDIREIRPDRRAIHHLDEDPWNNVPENLVAMHLSCHMRLHHLGKSQPPRTDEQRNRTRIALTKVMASPENRQRISDALRGRTLTDEHRKNIGDARRGKPHYEQRWQCGSCDRVTTARGLQLHQKWTSHSGKVPV